uniref:Endophilin-A3 n=1 Tax=Anthurium amnicola TaxID=1678845 RepID=A0A1D1XLF8_9ARAE
MEAIKKQASRLREQVAKQQQAVMKQFSGRFGIDAGLLDEDDAECHQLLQMLYSSTREAKHFQRNIVRGVEGLISVSSKQMEIALKLAGDCCKYGENQNSGTALARASRQLGTCHNLMERERENLLRVLGDQVYEPLRAMIMGAPLEDARHLTYRYEKIRQDVEAQVIDVAKRQLKSREAGGTPESLMKLQQAELRLSELRSTLLALGRESTSAMQSVESQQQRVTFQQLLAMVDAERTYHKNATSLLDELHSAMVLEKQQSTSERQSATTVNNNCAQTACEETQQHQCGDLQATTVNGTQFHKAYEVTELHQSSVLLETHVNGIQDQTTNEENKLQSDDLPAVDPKSDYFIAQVIHPFDAQADGELSLSVGDYVVVRQVSQNGWSEGECQGEAGWFPSAYVEQRDKAPANKVIEAGSLNNVR